MSAGAPQSTFFPASTSPATAYQRHHDPIHSHRPASVIVNLVFLVIATSVGLFRLYTRAFVSKVLGSDDVFIVFAIVCGPALECRHLLT
jgi:hypothetical protein